MNTTKLVERLSAMQQALPPLVLGLDTDDARWKPADGAWSVLEIVRHLVDEETDDFRQRLQLTLEDPGQEWPPIDPEAAAVERRYNNGTLEDAVANFVRERQHSIDWLSPRLDEIERLQGQAWTHPKFGPISVGDLFGAWVAHDQLHLRQIAKRMFQLTERHTQPASVAYAGTW